MNATGAGRQIRAWTAVGAMTPDAIFTRFDQRITNSYDEEEVAALERNFKAICDNNGHVSESAFTTFANSKISLSPMLKDSVRILFDSLCYLSQVPLQRVSPPPNHLTLEGLKRALMWIFPSRERSVIDATVGYRIRSPVDHRRLIFQSLATSHNVSKVSFEVGAAESLAVHNATDFPPEQIYDFQEAGMNVDEDGDEMYQDVLDILVSTQPYIPPGLAEPDRDAFRELAKKLHEGAPLLHELAVPKSRLETFLSLLLARNFVDGVLDIDEDLQPVAHCIAESFYQRSGSNSNADQPFIHSPTSVQEVTWPMFNFAVSKLLPHLFDPLSNLLGTIFFDQPCPFDANIGYCPTAEDGVALTLPRMAQLEEFLFDSICMADIRCFQNYSEANWPTISELAHAIECLPGSKVLIFSGCTLSGETCIFGAFIAHSLKGESYIDDGDSMFEETALLFQLSPIHDIFRGRKGKSAWSVAEDRIVFGHEDYGAALILDSPLTNIRFTHNPSTSDDNDVYHSTKHRGKFEIQLRIQSIELWSEASQ